MDINALSNELENDPAGVGYQAFLDSGNINEVLALLQSEDPEGATTLEPIRAVDLLRISAALNIMTPIEEDAATTGSPTRDKSKAALRFITPSDRKIRPEDLMPIAESLISNGVIQETDKAVIENEMIRPLRREEVVLGLNTRVRKTHIHQATT